MNYRTALEVLGLGPGVGPERVLAVYRELAAPLKRTLLGTFAAERKREARDALRRLVCAREVARGRPPPTNWRGPSIGISTDALCEQLAEHDPLFLDPPAARALLGLDPDCSVEQVHEAFLIRRRALMRRFARTGVEAEAKLIRDYAARLRLVRDLAMPPRPERSEPVLEESAEIPVAAGPFLTESESIEVEVEPGPGEPPPLWEDELSSLPESGETISIQVAYPAEDPDEPEIEAPQAEESEKEPAEKRSDPVDLWFDDESDGDLAPFEETLSEVDELSGLDEFVKADR
jgi:hypothetical protein